jgi:hypothetical protein
MTSRRNLLELANLDGMVVKMIPVGAGWFETQQTESINEPVPVVADAGSFFFRRVLWRAAIWIRAPRTFG